MSAQRYSHTTREVQAGDAAYILDAWSEGFTPCVVVAVTRCGATVATVEATFRVRLAYPSNNVVLTYSSEKDDPEVFAPIRARLALVAS